MRTQTGQFKVKGYVQTAVKQAFEKVAAEGADQILGWPRDMLYVMVCGNKNALGKSSLESLCLPAEQL